MARIARCHRDVRCDSNRAPPNRWRCEKVFFTSDAKTPQVSDILFPYRSPSHRSHPDPTQHPRNEPETDPKRTRTEPNGAEMDRNQALSDGTTGGGLSGWEGVGVVREKENHYLRLIWIHRKRATKAPAKILRCWPAMRKISGPEKGININNFARNPPRPPPSKGPLTP